MSLKPFKVDCYFLYRCPYCEAIHQQSYDEIQKIGKILCVCGKVLKFAKMLGVKVIPNYEVKQQPTTQLGQVKNKERDKEVIKGLIKLGFYKPQAEEIVDKTNSCGIIYKSDGDFFQACVERAFKKC